MTSAAWYRSPPVPISPSTEVCWYRGPIDRAVTITATLGAETPHSAKFPTSNPVRRGRRRPREAQTNERLQLDKVGWFSSYGSKRPVGPWSVAMLALAALVASLGAVSNAAADDCVALGGFINAAAQCEITNVVPGVKTGTFTIAETLRFTDGGQVNVGAAGITINVTAGDFIMDAGAILDGNVTGCNTGAPITVALASGNVNLETLSIVRSNSGSGGFIQITTSARGTVNIDGIVDRSAARPAPARIRSPAAARSRSGPGAPSPSVTLAGEQPRPRSRRRPGSPRRVPVVVSGSWSPPGPDTSPRTIPPIAAPRRPRPVAAQPRDSSRQAPEVDGLRGDLVRHDH